MKRLKHNLKAQGAYTLIIFIILIPLFTSLEIENWLQSNISISIIVGLLIGILNDILTQLRKLNGEKFPQLEEPTDKVGQINS